MQYKNCKQYLAILSFIPLIACTSLQEIENQPNLIKDSVTTGDHLLIYENNGRIVDMILAVLDEDILKGMDQKSNTLVEIDINNIEKIEIEKLDGGRTTLAVIGGTLLAVPFIFGIMLGGMEMAGAFE